MKKIGILNSCISNVISKMGHNDMIAIGDCGLPIPDETMRIDLALIKNIPTFIDTLKAVLLELQIEEAIVAVETKDVSPSVFDAIKNEIDDVKITLVTHEELKNLLKDCKAVIRTGEQTPYANVILKSGVVF
ncbi:D-ribose pyranase [Fervidicella metallireducens AeB]|uniref:D-ribose pyranase n=1 Tax=Fervidicella metallireducens AeB TaxID=1403537 RepID=A0A017RS31_9CLOT|nr:D-ribose pyranase [Fervidicella metallireducens]EYE87406.1 D-ribose pyranase [Fervidicella metallireducens AeB]